MPRIISKKRARYLQRRGEFIYKGICGNWLWNKPVKWISPTEFKYINIVDKNTEIQEREQLKRLKAKYEGDT